MTEERFCHKLGDQPQLIQGPGMLGAGGDEVDAGGLDAGVAQHVSQLCHIPAHPVETPGKQVAQVVGKDLAGATPAVLHSRFISAQICRRPSFFSAFASAFCVFLTGSRQSNTPDKKITPIVR